MKDLPDYYCKGLQVEYTSFSDDKIYKTKKYNEEGKETSFIIGERFEHEIPYLTSDDIEFFLRDKVCFKIYAYETVEKKGKLGLANRDEIIINQVQFKINDSNNNSKKNKEKTNRLKRSMTRANTSGNLKKSMTKSTKNIKVLKDLKDKDCLIF